MNQLLALSGRIRLLHFRDGALLHDYDVKNKIVWDGKTKLLNQFFRGVSTWTAFYVGILKNPGTLFQDNEPSLASLFAEEFTTYTEATRQAITFEAPANDATYIYVKNSSANYVTFNIDTGVVNQIIRGIYVVGQNTKAVQPTLLWCTAAFGNNDASPEQITINTGDILKLQYTVRIPTA